VPEPVANAAKSDSPNMIVRSFDGDCFTKKHVSEILELFTKFDTLAIGPGLGIQKETFEFVQELLAKAPDNKPIIIDADALKALKDSLVDFSQKEIIVTPHAGEFAILFGETPPSNWFQRLEFLAPFAKQHKVTILLKGKYDTISDGINSKINRTGHEGMTVGGTGDVLTGIVAAISALNTNLFRAASVGSYIAGKAGELAAADFGNSLLATDVIEKIPEILLSVQK
jgi:NAD(P)H-hydrate epimerase